MPFSLSILYDISFCGTGCESQFGEIWLSEILINLTFIFLKIFRRELAKEREEKVRLREEMARLSELQMRKVSRIRVFKSSWLILQFDIIDVSKSIINEIFMITYENVWIQIWKFFIATAMRWLNFKEKSQFCSNLFFYFQRNSIFSRKALKSRCWAMTLRKGRGSLMKPSSESRSSSSATTGRMSARTMKM